MRPDERHTYDLASCINWQNCSTKLPSGSPRLVGWIPESPGRGTLSLLFNCVLTIFLCTWVVEHPRIDSRKRHRALHKLAQCLKGILAPELIAVEGAQEWTQARRILKGSNKHTDGKMSMVHAFYIGMLGIRYRTVSGDKVLWPNQFVWLLEKGLFRWENHAEWDLAEDNIQDRSNADGAAKLIAMIQVLWFLAQSVMRAAHDLPLAPFESMTLGYIPLFALTYFFWWRKPKDIKTPSIIDLPLMTDSQKEIFESMAVSNDFDHEGEARQTSTWAIWYLTPRTFEKEAQDREIEMTVQQSTEIRAMPSDGRPTLRRAKQFPVAPSDQIVLAHWDPDLYRSKLWPVTCLFGISFPALHLISWDGTFPTYVELWLWRGAAIASIVTMLIFMHHEKLTVRWRDPWSLAKVLAPGIYLASRFVMLAEAFAAFRASSPAVYETYVVWNYIVDLQ